MKISEVRDFLVVITTIITILGVFFKAVNSFFIDVIKNSFEVIPGKNSLYNTVIKTIVYIILSIEIIIAIGIFILMIIPCSDGELGNNIKGTNTVYIIIKSVINMLNFALIYLIIFSERTIIYLLSEVYKVLGIKGKSTNNNFFEKHLKGSKNSVKKINGFKMAAIIIVSICIIFIIVFNSGKLLEERVILGIIAIFSISVYIILNSLNPIVDMLSKKYRYYIVLKNNQVYIVNFFLEFENNYLIVEEGIQRYISKQEVIEIKKVLIK